MALVSVIMPVWRPREDWLRLAVESVLEESGCEIELLLVDDGNETPVSELLGDIDDPRIRHMRVPHCGPYATRNAALRAARGDYIRFVDSDDTVERGSTGKLLALARRDGREMLAYGATMMCDEELMPRRIVTETFEGFAAEECLLGGFQVYVVSIIYPRAVLQRSGAWEERGFRVSGDWDFVLRALEQAPVRRLDEVVSYYRKNSESVSRTARISEGVAAAKLVVDRYFERHPDQLRTGIARRAYSNLHLQAARLHLGAKELPAAARHLLLGGSRSPFAALSAAARFAARRASMRAVRG